MKRTILFLASILLALVLITCPTFALTYRSDVDNGSWSQYDGGLTSDFYQDATSGQSTYNRSFETSATLYPVGCAGSYCSTFSKMNRIYDASVGLATSTDYAEAGSKSLKITNSYSGTDSGAQLLVFAETEKVSDANVTFSYNHTTINVAYGGGSIHEAYIYYGYVDDSNNFISAGTLSTGITSWTTKSFIVPSGSYRIAFLSLARCSWGIGQGCSFNASGYIDNIKVIRNNVGTFRQSKFQPACDTILSCSNIESHLPSSELGLTLWMVDYISGASCSWALNGTTQGYLTEGSNGMYWVAGTETVTSNDYRDVNLTATCSKNGYNTKSFKVSPRLYKYNNITNGNFETPLNISTTATCQGSFCSVNSKNNAQVYHSVYSVNTYNQDGKQALLMYSNAPSSTGGNGTSLVYSQNEYVGGATVSFYYNQSVIYATGGSNPSASFSYGYVNDSNSFTAVGTLTTGKTNWTYISYDVPAGSYRTAFQATGSCSNAGGCEWYADAYIDNISSSISKQTSVLTATNTKANPVVGDIVNFYTTFNDSYDLPITATNTSCIVEIGSETINMTYNSSTQRYEASYGFITNDYYVITHSCTSPNYNSASDTYAMNVSVSATVGLIITPISNITSVTLSDTNNLAILNGNDNTSDIIFKAETLSTTFPLEVDWYNSDTSNKIYSAYTSTDGINWTFSDTISFGSSSNYDDPIQKIWGSNKYLYELNTTLTQNTPIYFKLQYHTNPLYYTSIYNNLDWATINAPTQYYDGNNHIWDVYQDSNYSNLLTYTTKSFSQLVSTDMNAGYELQFTAYASATKTIQVGYRVNGIDTVVNVDLSTTKTRYSIPINTNNYEAKLLIKATTTTNQIVYMTDYAIVPRSYFSGRMEITQFNGQPLQAIRSPATGRSTLYIQEGLPFTAKIKVYDKEGDLATVKAEALIGATTIKTYYFNVVESANQTNHTHPNTYNEWSFDLAGVMDLNGYGNTMRNLTVKITLTNSANKTVAEQYKTISLVQYPFFAQDIVFNTYALTQKVGENPKFSMTLIQKDPNQFVGLGIKIWKQGGSINSADYNGIIYNDTLNCGVVCQKEITLDDFVWEAEANYYVQFTILTKTEYMNYVNPLTNRLYSIQVTERKLDTARILQVFERQSHQYRNDEPIPLVLQLKDVPSKDLRNDFSVHILITVCDDNTFNQCGTPQLTKFLPSKSVYDETTGYTYFYWNNVFYLDNGSLLPDGKFILFNAQMTDLRNQRTEATINDIGLTDKCQQYPTDEANWNPAGFLMNVASLYTLGLVNNTCQVLSPQVVEYGYPTQAFIDINADFIPTAGENQSVFCINTDQNSNYVNSMEQEITCGILYKRGQRSIDQFDITFGNEYSDYSITAPNGQYIQFTIPAEVVIFNDPVLLRKTLDATYTTDTVNTVGQAVSKSFDKIFSGIANPLTGSLTNLSRSGIITNVGADINWDNAFDPNYVSGIFFFKVKGLKVVNQYDYVGSDSALKTQNPKYFTTWAESKKIKVTNPETQVTIYGSDLKTISSFTTPSKLIIYAEPSKPSYDSNAPVIPTRLSFNLVADMLSANQTATYRTYLPLTFTYIVPDKSISPIVGMITSFAVNNWFWGVLFIVLLLIASVIYMNFRSGKGVVINNNRK